MIGIVDTLAFETTIPIISAFFIGIATSIAPCTFATNVAAISYIAHFVESPKKAFRTALSFTFGRMATYIVLGIIMISAGRVVGSLARDTQSYGNLLMGPVLILIGLAFAGAFSFDFSFGNGTISKVMPALTKKGLAGSFALGALFALAFCPYSGMLFFGMLIPMALNSSYGVALPGLFGVGVSMPVLIFSILIYHSASRARSFGKVITSSWRYVGRAIGLVILTVGCYTIAPYLAQWYGVDHAFWLLSLFFWSLALYLVLRKKELEGDKKSFSSTENLCNSRTKSDASHSQVSQFCPAVRKYNPSKGGIPPRE